MEAQPSHVRPTTANGGNSVAGKLYPTVSACPECTGLARVYQGSLDNVDHVKAVGFVRRERDRGLKMVSRSSRRGCWVFREREERRRKRKMSW